MPARLFLSVSTVFVFLVVLSLLFTPSSIHAEDPYPLDGIVVTASRTEEPLREAPANVTIITREEVVEKGAQTLVEVFRDEPGLFVTSQMGNSKFSTVDIRGYGEAAAANVLFLIDGRRVNNVDISGADLSQIPLEMVERIEVYRGPASVMFGDNAAAGAVNLILRRGEGPLTVAASLAAGTDRYRYPTVTVSGAAKALSYFLLGSVSDTDGYRHNNHLRTHDAFGSFSVDPNDTSRISLKAGYHKDSYGMPGPLPWSAVNRSNLDPRDSLEPDNNGSTEDAFADLEAQAQPLQGLTLSLGASYRTRHTASWFEGNFAGFTWYNQSKGHLETLGFTPKVVLDRALFSIRTVSVAGFDYYRSPYDVNWTGAFGGFPSSTSADIEKADEGFYITEKAFLTEQLIAEAGFRTQSARYDIRSENRVPPVKSASTRERYREDAFRCSLNYLFDRNGNIFATYSKGFRFPAPDELFNVQTGIVNPALEPQRTYEFDVGIRWNPWTRAGGALTLFQIRNRDEIYYNPLTFANGNYDRTLRRGAEVTVNLIPHDSVKLDLSYSYVRATFDRGPFEGNDIPFVPRNKIAARLQYIAGLVTVNGDIVYTGDRYAISDQDNNNRMVPGFTTVNVNATYEKGPWFFQVGATNLFDAGYSQYAVASAFTQKVNIYPAPGRQVFFKLKYTYER